MGRASGCGIRRIAGLVSVVSFLGLIAAPAALANGDAIKAAAGVQFSGVVDQFPTCSTATAIAINWGDNTSSAGTYDANGNVIGTHTYAAASTYNGTVTLTGGSCDPAAMADTFTATVSPAPQFKQCPPVDADFGCQFLIVVSNSATTILNDTNQGPYEGSEDALIGVQNNSSGPISSIPLSSPNSGLYSFEGDGICSPGAPPIPSGCVPPPGSATTCNGSAICSFPRPPGQPAGYTEPGAPSGSTQNGYEGPTSWYSNVSLDKSGGQVNFSPALQPGQSTYFSLEEPPTGQVLNAGSTPTGVSASPPTVSSTGASFSGLVNPNGSSTTAFFQYGLDARYFKVGASGPVYNHSTPPQALGAGFSTHFVASQVSGLVPNALYHVRLVATNASGTTFGPDMTFSTKKSKAPGTPAIGKSFNASVANGLVLILVHGQLVPLTELRQLPSGTVIDALNGTLNLITATGKKHNTFTGTFGGAIFKVTQIRSGPDKGTATLSIVEGAFKGAPTYASCKGKAADSTAHAALSSRILQTLRARSRGRYRTRGRYAAGTVRGTQWTTSDRCDGTLIRVQVHSVLVTDLVKHINVLVRAGHFYLAKAKH